MTDWAIYGGAGFIGQHLADSILSKGSKDKVVLLDIRSPTEAGWKAPIEPFLHAGRLSFLRTDVRDSEQVTANAREFDVIVNLAAIHREPGHRAEEYFETNVAGARSVCDLADSIGCREIIFTSSISVYGVHDHAVDEETLVQPKTPYGQSKIQAEKIHAEWAKNSGGRLSIIRPGVVFGPGENGNVTRLVRETVRLGRQIQIKPDQPKAGIYVEELLEVIHWLRQQPLESGRHHLVNGVSDENLTFNSYGEALQELKGYQKKPLTVSEPLLRLATMTLKPLGWILGTGSKFHPERLAKLTLANDVKPARLIAGGYPYAWPLRRALADWMKKGL